jgi:hypothetical protein
MCEVFKGGCDAGDTRTGGQKGCGGWTGISGTQTELDACVVDRHEQLCIMLHSRLFAQGR